MKLCDLIIKLSDLKLMNQFFFLQDNLTFDWSFEHNFKYTSDFCIKLISYETRYPKFSKDFGMVKNKQGMKKLWLAQVGSFVV